MRFLSIFLSLVMTTCSPAFATTAVQDNSITQSKLHSSVADPTDVMNCSIAASVGSSALTVALKNAAGSDASALSPCKIRFRSATSATGTYSAVSVTAALSVVVSSGSTLGTTGGPSLTEYAYIYAINNAGTVELAISSKWFDVGSILTTTAEGGAGAADSATAIYSTTARSNVAARLIGRIAFTEAVAGTWATTPSEINSNWRIEQKNVTAARAYTIINGQTGDDLAGTYARVATTVTVTATAHGLVVGNRAYLNFTSGTAVDGLFTVVTVADANTFTVTHGTSGSTSGNVTLERVAGTKFNMGPIAAVATGQWILNFQPCMPSTGYSFATGVNQDSGGSATQVTELFNAETPLTCSIYVDCALVNTAQNHTYDDCAYVSWTFFHQ